MPKTKQVTKQRELKLLSKPLSLSTDGHLITVKDDNSAEIIFFQINGLENNTLEAVGIANLRMTVEQLKALSNAIINTIKTHEDVLIKRSKKIN